MDHHMFNTMAVMDRIPNIHPLGATPFTADIGAVECIKFLPSADDEKRLHYEVSHLCGQILVKYCPQLSWMGQYFHKHIPHEYMKFTSRKSKVVGLGVLDENEASTEGMTNIMRHLHTYIPGHRTSKLVPIC